MNLIVGDTIQGIVSDFGSDGEGVIKLDGYPVFVPYAIKGEEIRARVTYVKKDCAFGELVKVLSPSPSRVKPRCPYFGKCGGCDLQHADTHLQLEIKRTGVENALKKFAGLDIAERSAEQNNSRRFDEVQIKEKTAEPNAMRLVIQTPVRLNDFEYRNKLSLPFAYNSHSGRVSLGFYEKRSHKVVPMKWCPLHGEWAADLITALTEWANEFNISVYDENTHKGLLRHAVARMLDTLSLTIVINGDRLPKSAELIEKLQKYFDDFALYISENTHKNNVIFGDSVRLIYGQEKPQNLGKFEAVVSPKSFLQINDKIRDAIYDEVAEALDGFAGDIVELYSGVGLLTAQLALRMQNANIISVEIEPSASRDAEKLMQTLGLSDRVKCICDDAKHYLDNENCDAKRGDQKSSCKTQDNSGEKNNLAKSQSSEKRRALILDPPRRGCDREVLDRATGFDKIVYISCNPQTLARDLKILSKEYSVEFVKPFDMFPQTANIEVMAVLSSK